MGLAQILNAIAGLLIVIGIGWLFSKKGWFPLQFRQYLPKIITNLALPCMLLTAFSGFDRQDLPGLLKNALLPYSGMLFCLLFAFAVAKIIHVKRERFGLCCCCIANSNTMYIGLPFTMALFGAESLPIFLTYYFANATFFWTVGNFLISGDVQTGENKFDLKSGIKRIFAPPIIALVIGISCWGLDLHLPGFLQDALKCIGALTVPLALLFIGSQMAGIDFRSIRAEKDLIFVLIGRLAISPLVVWGLAPLFALSAYQQNIFLTQAALPVLMQAAILTAYYNGDSRFGSLAVSFSAIVSVVTIPICLLVLGKPM